MARFRALLGSFVALACASLATTASAQALTGLKVARTEHDAALRRH